MTRRVRRPAQLPRCKDCHARIQWLRLSAGAWRTFKPGYVDGRNHVDAAAYPVENGRVWRFEALVEDLVLRHRCTRQEAIEEAYDMPWAVPHDCRTTTPTTRKDQA